MGKTICFICSGLAGGGMERALTNLANYYAEKGYKVHILSLFQTEQFFETNQSINVVWPNIKRASFHRFLYALLIIPYIRKNISLIKPDVIISFGEWFNPYVILSTRFLRVPLFISDRMGPELKLGFLIETSRKLLYKYANGIIAQTQIAAVNIQNKTKAMNIAVIPNPVNSIETDISVKKNQIITVGRLSPEKGQIFLVRAFALVKQTDWSLHIVGDGKERFILEKEVALLGLENRVFFHGHLKNFSQLLGESEIFVLPSLYEGFPNALLEAMSVPLACISSNCIAGPSDIIKNNSNGILVPTGDVNALAESLNKLIGDVSLRKEIARKAFDVREKFSFEHIAHRYLEFILHNSKNDLLVN